MLSIVWVLSIVATVLIAANKGLNVLGYFLLSLPTGPLAVIIALLSSNQGLKRQEEEQTMKNQLLEIRQAIAVLQDKVHRQEAMINKFLSSQSSGEPIQPEMKVEIADQSFIEEELKRIKNQKQKLQPAELKTDAYLQKPLSPPVVKVTEQLKESAAMSHDMELNFGRHWLNKIGLIIFTLGMGFLISYSFKYFGPWLKIVLGYGVSIGLFFVGCRLERKEKLKRFGQALLGAGWALVYFTTYAMHHFEASKVIHHQMIDVGLLCLVVVGMIGHAMKLKSEGAMSVAVFIAYLTATLGPVTNFTLVSCFLLGGMVIFFVYQFQWVKILILGSLMTYGIHTVWVMPKLSSLVSQGAMINFFFLSGYGLMFFLGIHLAKAIREDDQTRMLAAINIGNLAIYSILAFPVITEFFFDQRFLFFFSLGLTYFVFGLWMRRTEQNKLYLSDMVGAVFAITFSLSLKFLPTTALMLWFIEIPLLLYVGLRFKEIIFRVMSYVLTIYVAARVIFLSFENLPAVAMMGFTMSWFEWMSVWMVLSMGSSFGFLQRYKNKVSLHDVDYLWDYVFSFLCVWSLTFLIFSLVPFSWLTPALILEGSALIVVSLWGQWVRFRLYSYVVIASFMAIFVLEEIPASFAWMRWLIIGFDLSVLAGMYVVLRRLNLSHRLKLLFDYEETMPFWLCIGLLILAVFRYIDPQWISLILGLSGMSVIFLGIVYQERIVRLGGLIIFGVTLGRVVIVDMADLEIIFKIITFIVLGLLFLIVSFLYNRFNLGQDQKKEINHS